MRKKRGVGCGRANAFTAGAIAACNECNAISYSISSAEPTQGDDAHNAELAWIG